MRNGGSDPHTDTVWSRFLASDTVARSVTLVAARGQVSVVGLPERVQRELRFALYQLARSTNRTPYPPRYIQRLVAAISVSGATSLRHFELTGSTVLRTEKRALRALQRAGREMFVTAEESRNEGWFDPPLLGCPLFSGTQQAELRRTPFDLTAVTQRWLRDLLWEELRADAMLPTSTRPSLGTINVKIRATSRLSASLFHIRVDHGADHRVLTRSDAQSIKEIWDYSLSEGAGRRSTPIPGVGLMSEATRARMMGVLRNMLERVYTSSHEQWEHLGDFIFNLPVYSHRHLEPRPRPINVDDFRVLVSDDAIRKLEAIDKHDLGFADIWLTQAFQGGRISETLKLRLGCIGLIGAAQPYLWRDITKIGVVDWGMPCHLPVYERLRARQAKTLARLRKRYAAQLDSLTARGRRALEEQWERTMPLFPRHFTNLDLVSEIPQSSFRAEWTTWFTSLGIEGITTHRTRATLATSLLNNGAPPELVRQMLGHFSHEALAHYGRYNDRTLAKHLRQVWVAGPSMESPGATLLKPGDLTADDREAIPRRIDLAIVPVEHGLCRYGPVVGGANCPWQKNCTEGPTGACEHFVLTGADLAYWERKRDTAFHFAEGAPNDHARDYILSQWQPWEPVLSALRRELAELDLLAEAEQIDLRSPMDDYFHPLYTTGWSPTELLAPRPDA